MNEAPARPTMFRGVKRWHIVNEFGIKNNPHQTRWFHAYCGHDGCDSRNRRVETSAEVSADNLCATCYRATLHARPRHD